jgi:hypothetical protein
MEDVGEGVESTYGWPTTGWSSTDDRLVDPGHRPRIEVRPGDPDPPFPSDMSDLRFCLYKIFSSLLFFFCFFFFLFFFCFFSHAKKKEKNNVLRNRLRARTFCYTRKMSSVGGDNTTNVSKSIIVVDTRLYIAVGVLCVFVAIVYAWIHAKKLVVIPETLHPTVIAGLGNNYHTVRRRLLVLDMNGLLCHRKHVSELRGIPADIVVQAQRRGNQFVWTRPYVDEFLRYCLDRFDVAIWSSATQARLMEFMPAVVAEDVYQRLAFVWSQDQCDQDAQDPTLWKKDLRRVYALGIVAQKEDVLLMDDVVDKVRDNEPYSVMLINAWCPYGEGKGVHDDELRVGVGWLWHEIQQLAYYEGSVRDFIRERVERRNNISEQSEEEN